LQKAVKAKTIESPLKQKTQIIASLIVLDALTNYSDEKTKNLKYISDENYFNSIRAMVQRPEKESSIGS